MSDNKKKPTPTKSVDPKIEAIKDIIFGDTIKEIEKEFDDTQSLIQQHKAAVDQQLATLRNTMDQMVKELRQDLDKHVASLKEEMTQKFSQLQNSSANRSALGKMLEDIGKKLQS
jgi:transketolase